MKIDNISENQIFIKSDLNEGIYLIKLTNNNVTYSKKLIIQR